MEQAVATEWGSVFVRRGGSGPPVLLLHGFPETGSMWHAIAPLLAADLTVIVADLPGYGRSACPADSDDHSAMSKRALARTLVAAMGVLGHKTFAIVGHDRGGRVAYRAALDHPAVITKVAVLDVVPTEEVEHIKASCFLCPTHILFIAWRLESQICWGRFRSPSWIVSSKECARS